MRILAHLTWSSTKLEHGLRAYAREVNWILSINRHAIELPARSSDVNGVLILAADDLLFDPRTTFPCAKVVDLRGVSALPSDGVSAINHAQVGRMAADYLHSLGHRRFLAYGGKRQLEASARLDAFVTHCRELGGQVVSLYSERWVEEAATAYCQLGDKIAQAIQSLGLPLAVFAPEDSIADSFMQIALGLGYSVPAEIAVLGANNDRGFCEFCRVPLSSIDVNLSRLGYESARLLDRLMHGAEKLPWVVIPPLAIEARQSTEPLKTEDRLVVAILEYIREHFAEHMTVEDMLRDLHTSRAVAYERFQKHIGHPIGEEIERVRMNHARGLLVGSDYKIDVVARMSGYQNTASFGRAFKARFGETPASVRRRESR